MAAAGSDGSDGVSAVSCGEIYTWLKLVRGKPRKASLPLNTLRSSLDSVAPYSAIAALAFSFASTPLQRLPEKSASQVLSPFARSELAVIVRNMESERTLNGYFQDFIMEPSPELNPSSKKIPSCGSTACFDCNICLDFAADPVVTLCGHLYCRPCIFRWLHLDTSPRHCPVCKSSLSESSLVPLYGRGLNSKPHLRDESGIPERPREHRSFASPATAAGHQPPLAPSQGVHMYQNPHFYGSDRVNHLGVLRSTAGSLLGQIAFSLLPWAFRNHQNFYINLNQSPAMSGRNWRWRQELMVESWLHQLWLFLFCCALLCLVFF